MSFVAPIDKILLHDTVTWAKKRIIKSKSEGFEINNVRIHSTNMFFEGGSQQSVWGNWVLLWDATHSTPLPQDQRFSVGDIIYCDHFPFVTEIINVKPCYGIGNEIHHFELTLR